MARISTGAFLVIGLVIATAGPAVAQSIDIGPGGVRVDPRSSRERDRDDIRREERREEYREERREERRRDLDDDRPLPRRY